MHEVNAFSLILVHMNRRGGDIQRLNSVMQILRALLHELPSKPLFTSLSQRNQSQMENSLSLNCIPSKGICVFWVGWK